MYTIKITYKTGNSFGSHTEIDLIGACWENINKAGETLEKIRIHNNYFNDKNNYKKTFHKNKELEKHSEYSIAIESDNNEKIIITAFWRGYFERLISAEIALYDPDNDYIVEF